MAAHSFTTPKGNTALMRYREGTSDWNTLTSCLTEDEYGLAGLTLTGTAWDIGAHIGGVAVGLAIDNPDLHVVAVEPVPENVDLLRHNAYINGVDIEVIAGAVGSGPVEVRYAFDGDEIATHHAWIGNLTIIPAAKATKTITYDGLTVESLIDEFRAPSLVKIDTEGSEWDFLDSDAKHLPLIVGEWHNSRGTREQFRALLPYHQIVFVGPEEGPGGFRAALRG